MVQVLSYQCLCSSTRMEDVLGHALTKIQWCYIGALVAK